jgi:hypothetical protein
VLLCFGEGRSPKEVVVGSDGERVAATAQSSPVLDDITNDNY